MIPDSLSNPKETRSDFCFPTLVPVGGRRRAVAPSGATTAPDRVRFHASHALLTRRRRCLSDP